LFSGTDAKARELHSSHTTQQVWAMRLVNVRLTTRVGLIHLSPA
jgi:hypothetical protein